MNSWKVSIILILILMMGTSLSAQECDSIVESKDTSSVYFYRHSVDSLALGRLHSYRMQISGIQNYDQIFKSTPFFASLGNPGLAYKDLLFNSLQRNGFQFGLNRFDAYLFNNQNTEYYYLKEPFSELIYILGPKKEQMVGVRFHTRIFPTTTIGADFRYIFAPGRYQRQKSDNKSLAVTAQHFTRNRRYGIIANYLYNKAFVYENGGITSDSLFENNVETDRFVYPVKLYAAENQIREFSFYGNQFFNIQKKHRKVNDSTYVRRNIHAGRISHSFYWAKHTQEYIDGQPAAGFYDNIYLDSTRTHDSVYHFQIVNKLMWSNLGYLDSTERKPFYIFGAARHEYHELGGYEERKYFNQFIPSAGVYWLIENTYMISGRAEFVFGDYNGGDFSIRARFAYIPGKEEKKYGRIEFGYDLASQKPGWFYQSYSGNHFRWENDFKAVGKNILSLYYKRHRLKAGIEYQQLSSLVILNQEALPVQADKDISLFKAIVYKDFRFSIVGIDTKVAYQNASDESFIAVPDLLADVTFFVTLPLFQGATTIQPGLRVFYNTSYYADAYMPALREFYTQRNKEIGNFIYADVFLNFRIKRARMFFKYSHINALWGPYNYYMVPSYPMMDAGFRFGISWKFFD
jgi:hypothetical protein